ncbi:MAG: hypothetical protein AB7J28_08780 [Hyphomonadaceae bacterium]
MLKKAAFALIAVCALAACGAPRGETAAATETAAASADGSLAPGETSAAEPAGTGTAQAQVAQAAPRVTQTECAMDYNRGHSPPGMPVVAQQEEGWMLQAAPGALTCGPVTQAGVSCQLRAGGSVFYALQDYWWYDAPAGRTATVRVDAGGSPSCFLNEAG